MEFEGGGESKGGAGMEVVEDHHEELELYPLGVKVPLKFVKID